MHLKILQVTDNEKLLLLLKQKYTLFSRHVPSVATLPKTMKKRRSKDGEKAQRPTLEEYVSSSIPTEDIYITK